MQETGGENRKKQSGDSNASALRMLTSQDLRAVQVQVGMLSGRSRAASIVLDCPDEYTKSSLANLLAAAQSGRDAFARDAGTFFGDTNLVLRFLPGPSEKQVLTELYAKTEKQELTHPFVFRSLTAAEHVSLFLEMFEMTGSYHVMLGCDGKPDTKQVSLIKYTVQNDTNIG